jgi:hypothetical protein
VTLESEVKTARYNQREKKADAFGRLIVVRRLRPSERMKLSGMLSSFGNSGETVTSPDGTKIEVPNIMVMSIAASVCELTDEQGVYAAIPFPASLGELMAIYDRLDIEGMTAATEANAVLIGGSQLPVTTLDDAKN